MKTVKVDFNMLVRNGMVLASPSFASDELHVDDWVEAVDFADPDMSFIGVVEDMDDEGFAYLRMKWEPIPEEHPAQFGSPISFVAGQPPTGGREVPREDLILPAAR
jgi:hypothetical protein